MTATEQKTLRRRLRTKKSFRREISFWLERVDNYDFLRAVCALVRNEGIVQRFPILPDELVKSLEAAKRDIEEGRTIPHEEVMADLRRRFGNDPPPESEVDTPR